MIRVTTKQLQTIIDYLEVIQPEEGKEDRFRSLCYAWREWWEAPEEFDVEKLLQMLRAEYQRHP